MSRETHPSLSDAIDEGVLRGRLMTRTMFPGVVTAFHRQPRPKHCSVRIGFKAKLRDGRMFTLGIVDRVPIVWPGNTGFTMDVDLKRGDEVLCGVCDRAMSSWIQNGGVVMPEAGRIHDPTDIAVLPGLHSALTEPTVDPGRETMYLGDSAGNMTWIRWKKIPLPSITLESTEVKLGDSAVLGVARATDAVSVAPGMLIWMTAVATATGAVLPLDFGIITGSSSKVKAE